MQRTELSFHHGGHLSLVFIENSDHPVDIKVNYLLGEVKVFDHREVYSAELFSQLCLTQKREWDAGFFEQLKSSFKLALLQHDAETSEVLLSVPSHLDNQSLLRYRVKKVLGRDRSQLLFEYMHKLNEQEKAKKRSLQLQVEGQKHIYNKRIQELEKTQLAFEEKTMALLSKFSGLYREKVKKLMQLKDDREEDSVFPHSHQDRRQPQQKSIPFHELSSMFMPSMDFRP